MKKYCCDFLRNFSVAALAVGAFEGSIWAIPVAVICFIIGLCLVEER